MTPFVKLLKSTWEKVFGCWDEGPEPPDRLAEITIAFANAHPHATRREWMHFAADHACESYRSGYLHGYEHAEREPPDPNLPEKIADSIDPNWRWNPGVLLVGGERIVKDAPPSEEEEIWELIQKTRREDE